MPAESCHSTPPAANEGSDEYVSDPAHPVPFINYMATAVPQRYMTDDQRFAARRTDVLTYQTEPLEEDVTIAGPVSPKLKIASTGTDSDFVVKLIDVYPNDYPDPEVADASKRLLGPPPVRMGGYQQLLRGEPMRAKFRNSWEKPQALDPGKTTDLNFTMPDVNHTFRRGHRIMIQIQSSWFPLVDRNPQTFTEIPDAKPEDFKKATEQVFHNGSAASGVEVMVLHINNCRCAPNRLKGFLVVTTTGPVAAGSARWTARPYGCVKPEAYVLCYCQVC